VNITFTLCDINIKLSKTNNCVVDITASLSLVTVLYCLPLLGIHLKLSVFFAGYVILTYYVFEHLIMLRCLLDLQILLSPLKMSHCSHQDTYVTLYQNMHFISLCL